MIDPLAVLAGFAYVMIWGVINAPLHMVVIMALLLFLSMGGARRLSDWARGH